MKSGFFKTRKYKKIINLTLEEVSQKYKDCTPRIVEHFWYGAIDISPQNLVIWYLFETNEDLKSAENNGLREELINITKQKLISKGFPSEAFESSLQPISEKVKIVGGSDEMKEKIFDLLSHKTVSVAFTTRQDIQEKANGDYHLYFQ